MRITILCRLYRLSVEVTSVHVVRLHASTAKLRHTSNSIVPPPPPPPPQHHPTGKLSVLNNVIECLMRKQCDYVTIYMSICL